ncbi:hypothetical protein ACFSOZ_11720 [Mesorhizobium newzealandense]|uniref:Uncharacterized protein n=1 Tax=Mesorhizobium newzealandense TaxID=1300302 RepID=A0ABW4UAJ1_9HYPH
MTSFFGCDAMNLRRALPQIPSMKVRFMDAMPALVLTSLQLRDMLTEAAKQGAVLAVQELRADLRQAPEDATLKTTQLSG